MNETFTNKIGTEIFARYFFGLTESIPNDRVIDREYQIRSKQSLLNGNTSVSDIHISFGQRIKPLEYSDER